MTRRVRHVADWIASALAEGDAWLADADDKGRPRKLLKLGTLTQAEAEADKAMHLKNQRLAARLVPDDEGETTVMAMPDGYRIVQMTSVTALDRESAFMGHCVGQGGYDQALEYGSRQFFSLRDASNKPHATFEVDPQEHALLQCKGKKDKPPVARYMPQVQAFLRVQKYRLSEAARHTGLIEQDGEYHDILNLPKGFHCRGDLDLRGTSIAALPEGLQVGGYLDLIGTPIAALPEGLQVGGYLDLMGTPIAALPERLRVGGNLYLRDTPIAALPGGLQVGGHLDLRDTPIAALPEGLQVGGDLDLRGTPIAALHGGLQVGGNLYLPDGRTFVIPGDAHIVGSTFGQYRREAPPPAVSSDFQQRLEQTRMQGGAAYRE